MSPLEIDGKARLIHINARKEGPEDAKVLAADLKFVMTVPGEFLIAFHPQLRVMLFTKENEPRFPLMGPIDWDQELRSMHVVMEPATLDTALEFFGVKLKKWTFSPRRSGAVEVSFQAQVQPDRREFGAIGQALIGEEVKLQVRSQNGDLFAEKPPKAPPQKAEEPAEPPPPPPAPASTSDHDNVVPAMDGDGKAVGFELDKRQHPVGTRFEHEGVVYDVIGQGADRILVELVPPKLELTDGMLQFMKTAGAAEAKKDDDDRDFETGLAAAVKSCGMPKDFFDEHRSELESAFADGYDEEISKAEQRS